MDKKPLELPQWLIDWCNAAPIHIIDLQQVKTIDTGSNLTYTSASNG